MSGLRLIGKLYIVKTQTERVDVRFEDDTRTDTCAVGNGCYIEHYSDRYCIFNPFLFSYEGQTYQSSMQFIVMTNKMVNITLFMLIGHSILRMNRLHLCQFSR